MDMVKGKHLKQNYKERKSIKNKIEFNNLKFN